MLTFVGFMSGALAAETDKRATLAPLSAIPDFVHLREPPLLFLLCYAGTCLSIIPLCCLVSHDTVDKGFLLVSACESKPPLILPCQRNELSEAQGTEIGLSL